MRALNVPRRQGWIGGVCAGVGERLGIDPLIVRGITVVIAVLGGPAFLLYAAAWLLLPDTEDRIHLERLIRGDFDRAIVGIGALVVLSMLPFAQGFWFLGSAYWGPGYWPESSGRVLWTILLLAAAVVAIVWVARRASHAGEPIVTPATTDARPETMPDAPSGAAAIVADSSAIRDGSAAIREGSAATGSAPTGTNADGASLLAAADAAPVPPPTPAPDAPPEDLAAWREQQERWKTEHAAWKQQQAASERELRDHRAAEAHARAVANSAVADERRRLRRLANPRVTGSHVVMTLGAALLVGGIAAITSQSGDGWTGYGVVVGLAAATITVGLSAIIAGAFRRRSGFLGFVALLLAASTVLVSFVPPGRTVVATGYGTPLETGGRFAQLVGTFSVVGVNDSALPRTSTLDLWQGTGDVDIHIPRSESVRIEANLRVPNLWQSQFTKGDGDNWDVVTVDTPHTRAADGRYDYSFVVGSGAPTRTVRIWQGIGSVSVSQDPPLEAESSQESSTAPLTLAPGATDPASPDTGAKP